MDRFGQWVLDFSADYDEARAYARTLIDLFSLQTENVTIVARRDTPGLYTVEVSTNRMNYEKMKILTEGWMRRQRYHNPSDHDRLPDD